MQLPHRVESATYANGTLVLHLADAELSIRPLVADLIQLRIRNGSAQPLPSVAVIKQDWPAVESALLETDDQLLLTTPALTVAVSKNPLRIRFLDRSGRVIAGDHASGGLSGEAGQITWKQEAPAGTRYYGFGQKLGFLDKRGRKMTLWNTDEPHHAPDVDQLYQSVPFFLALQEGEAHGLFIDSTARITYDMAKSEPDAYTVTAETEALDAYFFAGPDPKAIISRYTELTGRMELPPRWALGFQQCRWSYPTEARVREIARELRERKIPCDVIYLDIDYMDGYRVFTWDKERFPNPQQLVADLAEQGFKVITIVDPGVKVDGQYAVFREGVANRHFVNHADGELFIGTVWPGKTAFPDFCREETRRWWGDLHGGYVSEVGIAGIWNDMNEPSCFARNTFAPTTVQGEDGAQVPHSQVHNAYGHLMAQATYDGLKRLQPTMRPFILTRSGYAGTQRYSAVWMGDNHSWWEHLLGAMPICMGMGLSGLPFVGTDMGGFSGDCDGELLARWTQMGALTPFARNHAANGTRDQEPWAFGPQVEAICREYLELRYRLMPFLYNEFYQASQTGLPIMRPLLLEYPADPAVQNLSDQFLVGRDLLAAPVYQPGATHRMLYLPAGEWIDFWTGRRLSGPAHIVAEAPLHRMPLYVRAGAIIPMGPVMQHTGEGPARELTLKVYAGQSGHLDLYEDEGEGYGPSSLTAIALEDGSDSLTLTVASPTGSYLPPRATVCAELYLDRPAAAVLVNGQPAAFETTADGALRILIETPNASGFTLSVTL